MARDASIPRVDDEKTDRAVQALSKQLGKSLISSGVLVSDFKVSKDGTLLVPHQLGRKAVGALVVGSDRGVFSASVIGQVDNRVELGISSDWELLQRIDVVAGGTLFDFDAVNGDLDGDLRIEGYWSKSTTLSDLLWRINGASSGSLSNCHSTYTVRGAAGGTFTGLAISTYASSTAAEYYIDTVLTPQTGRNRLSRAESNSTDGTAAANTYLTHATGKWEDTSTKILSVGVQTGTGNILSGSHFSLYRKPRLSGRTLNIWIF